MAVCFLFGANLIYLTGDKYHESVECRKISFDDGKSAQQHVSTNVSQMVVSTRLFFSLSLRSSTGGAARSTKTIYVYDILVVKIRPFSIKPSMTDLPKINNAK